MKNPILLFGFLFLSCQLYAVSSSPAIDSTAMQPQITIEDILQLKNREIGKKLGRKLKLGESIALSIVRGKLKRAIKRQARQKERQKDNSPGIALGFSITAYISTITAFLTLTGFLLIIGFICALFGIIGGAFGVKKYRDKDRKKFLQARTARTLGIVFFVLFALFFISAIAALSAAL